jgi:hypothetical protein
MSRPVSLTRYKNLERNIGETVFLPSMYSHGGSEKLRRMSEYFYCSQYSNCVQPEVCSFNDTVSTAHPARDWEDEAMRGERSPRRRQISVHFRSVCLIRLRKITNIFSRCFSIYVPRRFGSVTPPFLLIQNVVVSVRSCSALFCHLVGLCFSSCVKLFLPRYGNFSWQMWLNDLIYLPSSKFKISFFHN